MGHFTTGESTKAKSGPKTQIPNGRILLEITKLGGDGGLRVLSDDRDNSSMWAMIVRDWKESITKGTVAL